MLLRLHFPATLLLFVYVCTEAITCFSTKLAPETQLASFTLKDISPAILPADATCPDKIPSLLRFTYHDNDNVSK